METRITFDTQKLFTGHRTILLRKDNDLITKKKMVFFTTLDSLKKRKFLQGIKIITHIMNLTKRDKLVGNIMTLFRVNKVPHIMNFIR